VGPEYNTHFENLCKIWVQQLAGVLPPGADIPAAYEAGSSEEQDFVQDLALFLTAFFKARCSVPWEPVLATHAEGGSSLRGRVLPAQSQLIKWSRLQRRVLCILQPCASRWQVDIKRACAGGSVPVMPIKQYRARWVCVLRRRT
jgi:hypothetical protein